MTDHHGNIQIREFGLKLARQRQGGIGFVMDAKDDLDMGIGLQAETAQACFQTGLVPAQGLEQSDGGEIGGNSRIAGNKTGKQMG